jgi:hypothetical protein
MALIFYERVGSMEEQFPDRSSLFGGAAFHPRHLAI